MNCLRCGVQVEAPNVFCPKCLAEMEKHPVPRDATVVLPTREPRTPRRAYAPQDPQVQINQLKKKNRSQRRALWIFVPLCVLLLGLLIFVGLDLWKSYPAIGQNYQSIVSTQPPRQSESGTGR